MNVLYPKICITCLTKYDLNDISIEIWSLLGTLQFSIGIGKHICKNCKDLLLTFQKFQQNVLLAQNILSKTKLLEDITLDLKAEDTVKTSFETIFNWVNEVGSSLGILNNVKTEDDAFDAFHEETLFCESISETDSHQNVKEKVEELSQEKKTFSDDETLERCFQSRLQGTRRPYECPICKKCFTKGELKYHLNVHNNVKPFKCVDKDCGSRFSSPRIMRVHARRFHQLKVKAERPPYKRRRAQDQRYQDVEENPDKSKINVICSVCGKTIRKKHFSTHFQTHFNPPSDLSCPYRDQGCTEVFRMRHLQTSHIQKKHDPSYIPELRAVDRVCELCGKCFSRSTMQYHMNVHRGTTPYPCDFEGCTEKFKDPTLLRQHKRTFHLKIKTFRCRYCPIKLNSQEEYDEHKKVNCGEKSVACEICGKFINKLNLKCHLAIHKGERNWICPVEGCGKAFLLKNKLAQHSKSHSTECTFVCTLCNSAFKCKQSLTSHLAKKHSNSKE